MNDNLPPLPFGDDLEAWLECRDAGEIRQAFIEYGKLCRQQALEDAAKDIEERDSLVNRAGYAEFIRSRGQVQN